MSHFLFCSPALPKNYLSGVTNKTLSYAEHCLTILIAVLRLSRSFTRTEWGGSSYLCQTVIVTLTLSIGSSLFTVFVEA